MTRFLLDTNVISETVKPRPDQRVLSWIANQIPMDLFLASVTLGELVRGARRLKEARRRQLYERWIRVELASQFQGRILPVDRDVAIIWGEIMGDGDRIGRTPPAADAQIAAVARRHELTLATRNTRDFEALDIALYDPWTAAS